MGEQLASVHTQIQGRRESNESRSILRATHVLHPNLHFGLATLPFTVHSRWHHKPLVKKRILFKSEIWTGPGPWPGTEIPAAARSAQRGDAGGSVDGEFPAVLGADGGTCEGDWVSGGGEDLKSVAHGVGVVGLAPGLEAAPGLPRAVSVGADYEPGPGVGAADPLRTRGRDEGRGHGGGGDRRAGKVVNGDGPSFPLGGGIVSVGRREVSGVLVPEAELASENGLLDVAFDLENLGATLRFAVEAEDEARVRVGPDS